MEIKHRDGTFKTLDELYAEAVDLVTDEMTSYGEDLEFPNYIRENEDLPEIRFLEADEINDALEDMEPWDIIHMDIGRGWDDFFTWDGCDLETTSDIWDGVEVDEVAEKIVGDYYSRRSLPRCITEILDEYEEARRKLLSYSKYRRMAEEIVTKYKNCEANEFDLVYMLEKLVHTDEAWADEEE